MTALIAAAFAAANSTAALVVAVQACRYARQARRDAATAQEAAALVAVRQKEARQTILRLLDSTTGDGR